MINAPSQPTAHSLLRLIKSIPPTAATSLLQADQIHCHATKSGLLSSPFVATALLSLYSALGLLSLAHHLFDQIPNPGLVPRTALARAYFTAGIPDKSLALFRSTLAAGLTPDPVSLSIAVSSCRRAGASATAKSVHGLIAKAGLDLDPFVATELIRAYSENGELTVAKQLFDEIPHRTIVIWNALIHQFINHGFIEDAQKLFEEMQDKDVVSWNTLISGFVKSNRYLEALELFRDMGLSSRIMPNGLTMCTVLSACTGLGALDTGMWAHAYVEKNLMNLNGSLDHCLIDMYSKCGSIEKAVQVFEKVLSTRRRDLYSWTSIICGLAMHGRASDAISMFSQMQELGVQPDDLTLVGVLSACAHGGLVDQGCRYFSLMEKMYGITPKIEHYGCMVDLLGRVGRLQEAYEIVKAMPMEPNVVVWGALLSACKVHKDVEIAEFAAAKLAELEPGDLWGRVMLSHLYAKGCDWGGVRRVRIEMMELGTWKIPGCSSIEVEGEVHEFLAGGSLHSMDLEIRTMLETIEAQMYMMNGGAC